MTNKNLEFLAGLVLLSMLVAFATYDVAYAESLEDLMQSSIVVTGSSTVDVDPEILIIQIGVETTQPTAREALSDNSRLLNSTVEALLSLGISEDELGTSYFNIQPQYQRDYDAHGFMTSTFLGYTVSNTITVTTTHLDMAADIVDTAIEAGANTIDYVRFDISPETRLSIWSELVDQAVSNAIYKANLVLDPLDYQIVGVGTVLVDFGGVAEPLTRIFDESISFALDSVSAPIFAGKQSVTATVTITFHIGPI